MIDILKLFYTTHYNLGALAILFVFLLIFFLTKKNYKGAIIVVIILIVYNVGIYKRTEGKSWTIEIDPPAATPNEYGTYNEPEPIKMTFSATPEKWTITDSKGETHHWCWLDALWDQFANTDIVAWIWGENASKKMMKSTETRANSAGTQD
ncbi:hypothetical protein [Fibrobacter sp. UWB10]|uniref:hypothetical protein n=1 Tax=Fibrobacter sp. UWB10 TaxID=1896201 RepID=UPI00156AA6BC|nr:hypothetical protein [Fibrobacter sp. UWB10]MBO7513192.1 hypothetical protein [Fibrobacter sp.]SMP37614.1 hypothetical protein SAMN05720465_0031 [Fibrobacter sp. UWB10]